MTIAEQVPQDSYVGNGANDTFAFNFRILANTDLIVKVDGILQVEAANYTLQNLVANGGDVVFEAGSIPVDNSIIVIIRDTSQNQDVVYTPFDPFPAKTHEGALDKLTMLIQELALLLSTGTVGLPLDITGQFWDAGSLRIKNLVNPEDNTDAANKAYVDLIGSSGFDPDADTTISGIWTFVEIIVGVCSGNIVLSDLDPYTRFNVAEVITAAWTVNDGGGSPRKIAARNPRERLVIVSDTPTQADEGAILRVDNVSVGSIILEQLEAQTTFTIFAKVTGCTLVEGTGVTINHYDGGGSSPPTGNRVVARAGVVQVQYESPTEVTIYGNGIT